MKERSLVFWDFDGVIKDSVGVKTEAYVRLFGLSEQLACRVRSHHENNGGISRFDKIPLYLEWAGYSVSAGAVKAYCAAFASEIRQGVLAAPWVPGAREYLQTNCTRQRFVLLSATPQNEIVDIVRALQIENCFREVHGAPTAKAEAIRSVLRRWNCLPHEALMIGDSRSDYEAAVANSLPFLLRRTPLNAELQAEYHGPQVETFVGE